jgi:glutamate racemase
MIGVFDSGVGGMTVARAIEQLLPSYDLLYFGDLARAPYGSKSPETIIRYARQNTEFLISQGASLVVVACNSAASVAAETLAREFTQPLFEVITPAVEQAVAASKNGRIGVIGTRATVRSGIYERKIGAADESAKVYSQACPLLVPLVEEGWLAKPETKMILRRYLAPFKEHQIDTLVLGCTHYPLLRHLIQPRIGRRVAVIDSSQAVASRLKEYLETHPELAGSLSKAGHHRHYVSDVTPAAQDTANRVFERQVELIKVDDFG